MTTLLTQDTWQPGAEQQGMSLLVVDDHRVFTEVLCERLLELRCVERASGASTVAEAVAQVHALAPDVVFVDHDLGGQSGLDLLPAFGSLHRRPRLVVLSASSDPRTIMEALQSGADGWVVKNGQIDDVVVAARSVLAGQTYVSGSVVNRLVRLLIENRAPGHKPTFADGLSPRAYAVLRCLVSGLNRSETAARLYMSPNTVKTHVQKLLRVSGTHSTLALVSAARACGVPELDDATLDAS